MTAPPGDYAGSQADIARIPTDPDATVSFVHEYVHFLQAISSVMAFRLFAELVDLGIKGALVLDGKVDPHGGTVLDRSYAIRPILQVMADHAGNAVPGIAERVMTIRDELMFLFGDVDYPYAGSRQPGELDTVRLSHGTYSDDFIGVVTARRTFRPINLRMLTEGMARRIDRWVNVNHGFGHSWSAAPQAQVIEAEVYNGIRGLLQAPNLSHNVHPQTLDRLTVIVCYLALATPRPDHSVQLMIDRLRHGTTAGLLPATVGHELARVLIREGLLSAKAYNEVMDGVLHGESSAAMERAEFYDLYKQLGKIQVAANFALSRPDYFADEEVRWATVRGWMLAHSVPRVVATDGSVSAIDGIPCGNPALDFLAEVERVFL